MFAVVVETRTFPEPTVVMVVGEIDLVSAPDLREHVLRLPDGDLVLDISRVSLLAAAGLRALLELQGGRVRAGAQFVVAAPSAPARRALSVTGVDKKLPVAASVEAALALVSAAAAPDGPRHV